MSDTALQDMLARDLVVNIEERMTNLLKAISAAPTNDAAAIPYMESAYTSVEEALESIRSAKEVING